LPIYEYRCQRCGHELEAMQRITAEPLRECPECGAADGLKRLISQTSFVLKGSGWYVTDYKGKSAGASGGKASGNGEAKPASDGSSSGSSSGGSASSASSSSDGASSKKAAAGGD